MPAALAAAIAKAPYSADKLSFAWRLAVGPSVARATSVRLVGSELHVRAENPAWQREVERSAGLIRDRVAHLLGPDVPIRGLSVTVDAASAGTRPTYPPQSRS